MQFVPILIVGGGIAGISCAIELVGNAAEHLLLESNSELGGQLLIVQNRIRNFGGLFFESGLALQKQLADSARHESINFRAGVEVLSFDLSHKTVETTLGSYRADVLILATGARLRPLQAEFDPGLESQVIHLIETRENELNGKNVVIVGGGDYALMTALDLADKCSHVVVLHRREDFTARADLVRAAISHAKIVFKTSSQVIAVRGKGKPEYLEVLDAKTGETSVLAADALVIKIGCAPNTEQFVGQLNLTSGGYIDVDENLQTAIPGVFAIGDITHFRYLRLAAALGQGSAVAHSALRHLERRIT
jgi:thioredoxin reductase (NADPH)